MHLHQIRIQEKTTSIIHAVGGEESRLSWGNRDAQVVEAAPPFLAGPRHRDKLLG
uniref:Uncharacterized protein n=1 Tax=Arundo donax TaxID=35708 RepID=A0A0A9B1G8_ARUDO